jgi:hypothetical protein
LTVGDEAFNQAAVISIKDVDETVPWAGLIVMTVREFL